MSSDNDSSYNSDDSESSTMSKGDEKDSKANCIRNRSNFSIVKSFHMIDKKDFDPQMLNSYIEYDASPKLKLLMNKIRKLDEKDMTTSGKLYKHLIFTDVNRSAYGAKIIASAFAASGMNMVFHPQGTGFAVYPDEKLLETKNNNFAVLLSKSFYERPMNIKIRKSILDRFNSRPENIYGELIRFIILDQGFKEGIDLFDVKYVHLFEPLTVAADEKQAIGRATRFCGQKGLEFHPKYGWPLYVFKYDVQIPESHQSRYSDSKKLFELYLKYSNIDMRKVIFASELESAAIDAAVDHDLTRAIHTFAIEKPDAILEDSPSSRGGDGTVALVSKSPSRIMKKQDLRQYIARNFSRNFTYGRVQLENKCMDGGAPNIVSFTPTQDFIRNYFQPQSAYKGMLLYHSVGTGKTCTAIATATTSFDVEGYTILWVTRHTLKSDIWKNMFKQVCNIQIQNDLQNGMKLPETIKGNMRYVTKNWMEPISYKQFSNMLLKRNKIYNEIVRRNGTDDPLRKTLLIVDEAHKLYSPTVAKSEKPDTDILEKMIQNSYDKSGKDSVRVLLMTATPFTEDGMEMIQLLNLLKQRDHMPIDFKQFSQQYLDDNGYFTKAGLNKFQDEISGYISYLNRSQDARNFAHPVIQNVFAKLSVEDFASERAKNNAIRLRAEIKDLKGDVTRCVRDVKEAYKENIDRLKKEKKDELNKCVDTDATCKRDIETKYDMIFEKLEEEKEAALEKCNATDIDTATISAKMAELKEYEKLIPRSKFDVMIKEIQEKIKEIRVKMKGIKSNKGAIRECIAKVKAEITALEKEAKLNKKAKEEECKKLPVKERKGCKEDAANAFKALQESLRIRKEEQTEKCKDQKTDGPSKEDLKQEIVYMKGQVGEYRAQKRAAKNAIQVINAESRGFKEDIKRKTTASKQLAADIKKEMGKLKKIADKKERNEAIKEFRKNSPVPKELKILKNDIKELRSKVSKNNVKVKNAKISEGRLRLKNISQEYAFAKYCKV